MVGFVKQHVACEIMVSFMCRTSNIREPKMRFSYVHLYLDCITNPFCNWKLLKKQVGIRFKFWISIDFLIDWVWFLYIFKLMVGPYIFGPHIYIYIYILIRYKFPVLDWIFKLFFHHFWVWRSVSQFPSSFLQFLCILYMFSVMRLSFFDLFY